MTMNELAIDITVNEGKKKSLPIGQVKEVLGLVADRCFADPYIVELLISSGRKRALAHAKTVNPKRVAKVKKLKASIKRMGG